MTVQRFRLKEDVLAASDVTRKAGEIVYECTRHTYGMEVMDTDFSGVKHVAVTRNANGDYPFFTVPESVLEPLGPVVVSYSGYAPRAAGGYTVTLVLDGQATEYVVLQDSPASYVIDSLQGQLDTWLQPTVPMIEAGREELVRTIQENTFLHISEVDEDVLNDAVVFVCQAMREKLLNN